MCQVRREAESLVRTILDGIAAEGREPNAWEAECVRVALTMPAAEDSSGAHAAILAVNYAPMIGCTQQTAMTAHDFRNNLAVISAAASPGNNPRVLH